jgi:Protein of unknown function (DUF3047)
MALAVALFSVALLPATPAVAEERLSFGPDLRQAGWTIVSFPGISPASFKAAGEARLEVSAEAAAGLLCRLLDRKLWQARRSRWRWRVHEGAPATDLTKRGADDRALGVYFVFGAVEDAGKSPTALLSSTSVTALVYVFGGDKPRGQVLVSPHMGGRGKFIVLRSADAQKATWYDEDVDVAKDHLRAFGRPPELLLAVAIMSDSDDTGTRNRAEIDTLALDW